MADGTEKGITTGSAGHRHDRHCYWDHRECGWVCGPRPPAESRPTQRPAEEQEVAQPASPEAGRTLTAAP